MADLALRDKRDVATGKPQEEKPIDVRGELTKYQQLTTREWYSVGGGRRAPSARLVQYWANLNDLQSEIVEIGKDEKRAWCRVRGWRGEKASAHDFREAYVCHVFSQMLAESVLDALANGLFMPSGDYYPSGAPRMEKRYLDEDDYTIGEEGWPVVTNRAIQLQVMRNHLAKIKFAERDALSKAERVVYLKLLNSPWGDKAEDGEGEGDKSSRGSEETQTTRHGASNLGSLKQQIWSGLMTLSGGNEFAPILKSISAVTDPQSGKIIFPEVINIESIANFEHAEEILARVEAKLVQKEEEQ